jgi:hypothetical protein
VSDGLTPTTSAPATAGASTSASPIRDTRR